MFILIRGRDLPDFTSSPVLVLYGVSLFSATGGMKRDVFCVRRCLVVEGSRKLFERIFSVFAGFSFVSVVRAHVGCAS